MRDILYSILPVHGGTWCVLEYINGVVGNYRGGTFVSFTDAERYAKQLARDAGGRVI